MMRDPLQALAEARPAHLDPAAPIPDGTRATELARAMAGPADRTGDRAPRHSRRAVRSLWGLGLVGAAAAAALVVATTGTGGESVDRAVPAPATTTLSARTVLLSAAESSLKAPAAGGAYWYVAGEYGHVNLVGTKVRYLVADRSGHQQWTARSPKGESRFVDQGLGAAPLTAADKAAWQQDGSPASWQVTVGKPKAGNPKAVGRLLLESAPRKPFGGQTNLGDKVFDLAGRNVTVAELQALPADPAGLKRRILQGYAGHGTESSGDPMARDPWLFQVTTGLLREMPVKPAVRAAAYKILAGLKGVRSLGQVTDPLGRTGQGIGMRETNALGTSERQIIVNPATGILLTDQTVAVRGTGANAWAKPGTLLYWDATKTAGWTDDKPVRANPPGSPRG
ncbi:CU044_5270 family protein [Actinomadura scrupuli]|uniref:CU044_5270 family protein n=1 Tax=Actinomadura scrupuli TaxID=559629 RepID=UPI003D97228C